VEFVNEVLISAGTFIKQIVSGGKIPSGWVGWTAAASKALCLSTAEVQSSLKPRCKRIKNSPQQNKKPHVR